jgi:sugar lactone lactonase YvrE
MFITTAWYQMTPEQRAAEPLSGGIFKTKVDVPGVAEVRFGG